VPAFTIQVAGTIYNFAGKFIPMTRHLLILFRLSCLAVLAVFLITGFIFLFPAGYTENRAELSDDKEPKNAPFGKAQNEPAAQKLFSADLTAKTADVKHINHQLVFISQ
jgi:hypothetical protein